MLNSPSTIAGLAEIVRTTLEKVRDQTESIIGLPHGRLVHGRQLNLTTRDDRHVGAHVRPRPPIDEERTVGVLAVAVHTIGHAKAEHGLARYLVHRLRDVMVEVRYITRFVALHEALFEVHGAQNHIAVDLEVEVYPLQLAVEALVEVP
jgi:hypothetical protein